MSIKLLHQCYGILIKNLSNHWTNKKKLLGQFFLPLIISLLYIFMQKQKNQNPIIGMIIAVLLKMYIAMIGMSAVKELVTLFLTERQSKFRQYQKIFGLSSRCHTLSNLFYMELYMSLFLVPFYLTLNYFEFKLHYIFMFASFVISSLTLSMMLTSFFTDHKIASEIIGLFFSLSSMLALIYSRGTTQNNGLITYSFVDYLAMFIPNSSFSIAIMNDSTHASWLSLSLVKIYVLIYSINEYPDQYKKCMKSIKNKLTSCFTKKNERSNDLVEEFNMNDHINSVLPNINSSSVQGFPADPNCMISISNLIKTYKIKQGQYNALSKLSFQIKRKQIFGLLGRNGAGKTTLVDILTNVTKPNFGQFHINYEKSQNQDLQKIGICYQHQILYEELTMEQHLYFYSRIKNIKTDKKSTIEKIVQMLNIDTEYKKKVKQLSGGNKRKLSVAIAILGNPQLLIFDEPTSGLDPLSRRSVWEILEKLKKDFNSTIILTTHHLDEAQVLSDQICVIQKGKIIVHSTPEEIKQKYGNGYYLSIQYDSINLKDLRQSIESIKKYLQTKVQKLQQIQQENNIIKFFIKFDQMSKQQLQISLIQIIEWLENQQHIKIQIETNNLEQSFIAILKDPENNGSLSGESIDFSNRIVRPHNLRKSQQEYENQSFCQKFSLLAKQAWGIIHRCFYFHKGQSLKFFLMYNINILIFVFAALFNRYIINLVDQNSSKMPLEYQNALKEDQKNSNKQDYSNNMLIIQGYIIMASAFIAIPIYEKQKNIRRVFNSRGVSPFAYWLGTFIFDFSYYLFNLILMSQLISPKSFSFTGQRGLYVFIELGIGMIIYTYTICNIFQKISTANTWFSLINMVFGFIILPMIIIGKGTFLQKFNFIKYFYPYYDLNVLIIQSGFKDVKNIQKMMGDRNQIGDDGGPYIYYTICIYLIILIFIEIRIVQRLKAFFRRELTERVEQNIKLENVYKKYGSLQALKNVNYFVADQRLALLGHNGAGKSTTFGILSGQINQTCGRVYLLNKTKFKHQNIMRSSGICYQENCLWQNLTPMQIFSIFEWLVPISNSDKEIEWMLENLEFQPMNYHKRFENLSGGNKRKICMAVALFGDPSIRLLDECSTGLDPSSRLAMVETIKQSRSGSTIFTTHSMGEAESLCSKSVIMSKGQVLEFDYIYRLKQKYYNCFWIDLVFKKDSQIEKISDLDEKVKHIQKEIHNNCKQQKFKKYTNNLPKILPSTKLHKIRLQFNKQIWKLHHVLEIVYQLKLNYNSCTKTNTNIQSTNLHQPKLQDVYIRVTKQNESEQDENRYHYRDIKSDQGQDKQIHEQQLVELSFDK